MLKKKTCDELNLTVHSCWYLVVKIFKGIKANFGCILVLELDKFDFTFHFKYSNICLLFECLSDRIPNIQHKIRFRSL